ncbi:SDR family oxidoreductase [Pseudoduganella namucuonensis]|uniref:3(Or 17)beta-hydroxysteroid dehydrogenase n=1 Tax=Pseudoduganella namucuonensis TaxID=1035707 RepID=A0A1I7LZU2_9BURK|nr:SDR family oxidoreductase [Pseudoduganella namucuonensis]SFV15223.1 3(or 17)beta-hydroxysteroid dehydrogenase [Pseudoduganella namucuonensis]
MGRVDGKVALVTGAGSGLGRADALLLAREGARVVVTDINEEAGRQVARECGGVFVRHDVSSETDWQRAINMAGEQYGRLDVLVNNAGIVIPADIETTTLEQYRLVNAIHAEGTFLGCKYAVEAMKAHGGAIINIASITALRGSPQVLAYAAAKGAIRSLGQSVAAHCVEKGYPIRCNTVFPGVMATPLVVAVVGENYPGAGHPDDVANMVLFLASDESRFVNGAEFVVDNGASMRLSA